MAEEQQHYWGGGTRNITVESGSSIPVVICHNGKGRCAGLTFVLGAANIPLSKYTTIKDTLLAINHVVVGIYTDVLSLRQGVSHRKKAKNVYDIFNQLKGEFNVSDYNIVGHSIGGKIALLVAALHDKDKCIKSIIALDPVDQTPVEFSKLPPKGQKVNNDNLPLSEDVTNANIIMTCTDSGFFISKNHNAKAIQRLNRSNNKIQLVSHRNAGHMAYCDKEEGGYSWKAVMDVGTSEVTAERNNEVKKNTIELIQQLNKSIINKGGMAVSGVSKSTGKTIKGLKDGVKNSIKDMKNEVKSATSTGTANKFMMKSMLKSIVK